MRKRIAAVAGVLGLAVSALVVWPAPAWARAAQGAPLLVTVEASAGAVDLGDSIDLVVTVRNTGETVSEPTVVHLDITDPEATTSVDPEDWTPTLSESVGTIEPGQEIAVDWSIQPISPGSFLLYAVALSPASDELTVSRGVTIDVADRRSLDPGGILPVALGVPTLVGALLLLQLVRARRT